MVVHERGPHGYGDLNEAVQELLSSLSTNEATVCKSWFSKRDISKQTWQHPKSKHWHCIDCVMMMKAHRRRCLYVAVDDVWGRLQHGSEHRIHKWMVLWWLSQTCPQCGPPGE